MVPQRQEVTKAAGFVSNAVAANLIGRGGFAINHGSTHH
jgi:hypothetical protein